MDRIEKFENEVKELKESIERVWLTFVKVDERLDRHGINIKEATNEIKRATTKARHTRK